MITRQEVWNEFKRYPELVFTFDDSIIHDSPMGWDKSLVKFERNHDYYGIIHQYSGELEFWGASRDYINAKIETDGLRAVINATIYEYSKSLLAYTVLFTGVIDLADYLDNTISVKCKISDKTLIGYLLANKDIKYSLQTLTGWNTFTYYPMGQITTAIFSGFGRATSSTTPVETWQKPTISIGEVDSNLTTPIIFTQTYQFGDDITLDNGFTIRGDVNGICTMDLKGYVLGDGNAIFKFYIIGYNLAYPHDTESFLEYSIIYNTPNENKFFNAQIQFIQKVNYIYSLEINNDLASPHSLVDINIQRGFITCYTANPNLEQIAGYYVDNCLSNVVSLLSEGNYSTVSGLDDVHYHMITSGNWLRGIGLSQEPGTFKWSLPISVSFKMLVDFIKALGYGYKVLSDEIVFTKIGDMFDKTAYVANLGEVEKLTIETSLDFYYNSITAGYEMFSENNASKKYDLFAKKTWTTSGAVTSNELQITPEISGNAFEIDWKVTQQLSDEEMTDYENDEKIYCVVCDHETGIGVYVRRYPESNIPFFPASIRLFNLDISPIRLVRNMSSLLQLSKITEQDVYAIASAEKTFDFYSTDPITDIIFYENRDFTPESLQFFEQKLKPFVCKFKYPTEAIGITNILANREKLIIFEFKDKKYAGFIDDLSKNATINEPQNWTLLVADLTETEINNLL